MYLYIDSKNNNMKDSVYLKVSEIKNNVSYSRYKAKHPVQQFVAKHYFKRCEKTFHKKKTFQKMPQDLQSKMPMARKEHILVNSCTASSKNLTSILSSPKPVL